METLASINSTEAIQTRLNTRHFPRLAPFLMVFARPVFALLAQGLVVLLFTQLNVSSPSVTVRNWWTVYGTLVDLGCLGLLFWLVKREGIRLIDLVSFNRSKIKIDILIGLGIFIVVFPVTVFGGSLLAGLIAYGKLQPDLPAGAFMRTLPLLPALYSRLLWWPIWSFTEEITFQGYCLPRLQTLFKSKWLSVALVGVGWSVQHSFLPWINLQHALFLFIMFVPLTIASQLIYLKVRRLTPMILGHWLMDLTSVLFMIQIG